MHMQIDTAYRSIYVYAWDVLDMGVTAFVDAALAMGVTDVSLACSYHAGKFLRPHARKGPKVIFPEDGVLYFEPRQERYGEIKPQAHSDAAIRNVLADLLADGRLRVHAWTVLLHNSRLGAAYPHLTTQNVFGDRYVYSLCPMQPAVLEYARAVCRDLAQQYEPSSLILESPGWQPYAHGYHHEFAQLPTNAWLDVMLGMCFCDACQRAATEQGIQIKAVQQRIAGNINDYLSNPVPVTANQAQDWIQADLLRDQELRAFISLRQHRVTKLVSQIAAELRKTTQLAIIPTVQRPTADCWQEGSDLAALADVADYLEVPFYEPTAARAIHDARHTLRAIGDKPEKIRAILRPGYPDLNTGAELDTAITGLRELGISDFAFYNYGLLPQKQLDHLAATLNSQFGKDVA